MQILGLLGMYFDTVVVEVKTFSYFYSDWIWPYCGRKEILKIQALKIYILSVTYKSKVIDVKL